MGKRKTKAPKRSISGEYKFGKVTMTFKHDSLPGLLGAVPSSGLKDTGARGASVTGGLRETSDGAVRGRFDLIPPECLCDVSGLLEQAVSLEDARNWLALYLAGKNDEGATVFARFMLEQAGSLSEGLRRLAVHYGRGAKKYTTYKPDGSVLVSGDRNWQKGLETGRTVDSLLRHLSQYQAGDQSEDHLAAVVWNTFALMWHAPRIADGRLPKALDTYGLVK